MWISVDRNLSLENKGDKITIAFFCDEGGDDMFRFQLLTGLADKDIERLTTVGKTMQKEMAI